MSKKKREYDPMKNLPAQNEMGFLTYIEFEGNGHEFKKKINEIRASGIIIKSIDTEPIRYKYKVWYMESDISKHDFSKEQWEDLPGKLFGLYQISNFGRIRSIRVLSERNGATQTLTDRDGGRYSTQVKTLYKQIFGKELDKPSQWEMSK